MWEGLTPPYRTIVVDPPWPLGEKNSGWLQSGDPVWSNRLPYSTLSLEDINALSVRDLADRSAHLYVWTVTAYLRDTFAVVESWGFKPKNVLIWAKPSIGPGTRFRSAHEYVLFGTRGPNLPIVRNDVGTWHLWPRRGHSVKPPEFMDMVESVSPGPYVELFARSPRLGWDSWGYGWEQAS